MVYLHSTAVGSVASNGLGMRSRPLGPSPDSIYIHPADLTAGRADIMALELGMEHNRKAGEGWETARGRDAALLGSHSTPFQLSDETEEVYLSE
jgi:hypothetical protein